MNSTKAALEKYLMKTMPKKSRPRKNQQPEKQVEKEVLRWAKARGWEMIVTDAKAVYSQRTGHYTRQPIASGTLDLCGADDQGHAVFLELKAPGREKNLSEGQLATLQKHVEQGRFAVCISSASSLERIHTHWLSLPTLDERKNYLRSLIPLTKQDRPGQNLPCPWDDY